MALLVFVAAQIAVAELAMLILSRFLPLEGMAEPELLVWLLPPSVGGAYLATGLVMVWLWRRKAGGPAFGHGLAPGLYQGLALTRPLGGLPYKAFGWGFGLQFLMVPVALRFPPEESNPLEEMGQTGAGLAVLFIIAVLGAPLAEEVLFRALLFPALRHRWPFLPAALVTTLLFAGLHLPQSGDYWPAMAAIFACGWFLAWLKERKGSLWWPVAFHAGFNFAALLPLFFLQDGLPPAG